MKKYNKLAVTVLLTAMTAVTILSGCGTPAKEPGASKDGGKDSSAAAGSTAGEASEASESVAAGTLEQSGEPVTLRFLSWQSNHAEVNQAVADAYHEKNPNVTVEFEYVGDMNSSEYETKTDIMIMGGEPIDIVMTASIMEHTVRAASDSYLALDSFFEAEGTTASDEFNVIVPVNGHVYGIPAEMKYGMVLINKDMLDEAGLPVPDLNWTWDDYREYAAKMTKGSGADAIYGSFFRSGGLMNGVSAAKKGNPYFNDDMTLTFDNPYFSKFLQLRSDLETVDKSSVSTADIKALNMNYRDQFFSGKVAMMPLGTYVLSDIGNEKYKHDFMTTFARMPLWEENDEHYYTAEANVFSIARTSEHPQEAFDFLKYWSTEGVTIKGMFLSNEKNAEKMDSTNQIIKNFMDKVDVEALTAIMQDEKWVDSYEEVTPPYQNELNNILTEEGDKYLLGTQSLEETVQNLMKRGNAIIEENK